MPNLQSALKEEITRLARKEIRKEVSSARKQQAQHRRDIAALKREISDLQRQVGFLEKQETRRLKDGPKVVVAQAAVPAKVKDARKAPRFQARGLRSHRAKIGLSAADYGKLVGVSGLTIYSWEKEKTKPRKSQLPSLLEIRGIGRREALKRLELLPE